MRKLIANKVLWVFMIVLGFAPGAFSQQTTDENLNLGYDPNQIVAEWDDWYNNPTPQNEFIETFMDEFEVPQEGQHTLSRLEIWYWWASNNQYYVFEYIDRRDN